MALAGLGALVVGPAPALAAEASTPGVFISHEALGAILVLLLGLASLVVLWMADVIRPGSPERHGRRDVSSQPAIVWLFAGIVVYIAGQVGATLAALPLIASGRAPGEVSADLAGAAVTSLGAYTVGIATGAAMLYLMLPRSAGAGLRVRGMDLPIGVGWLLLGYPAVALLSAITYQAHVWVTGEAPDPLAHEALKQIVGAPRDPWAWLIILGAVVGAPIYEELVYRVCLQSAALRLLRSRWPALVLTAVVFALSHRIGQPVPWHAIVPLLALGLYIGLVYERTGRLGVPIAMHAAFNAGNIAMAFLSHPGPSAVGG